MERPPINHHHLYPLPLNSHWLHCALHMYTPCV